MACSLQNVGCWGDCAPHTTRQAARPRFSSLLVERNTCPPRHYSGIKHARCLSWKPTPQTPRATFGIDLGTSSSTIAVIGPDGRPQLVNGAGGSGPIVPSLVVVREDGQVLVGEDAAAAATANPQTTYYSFKRQLGRSYSTAAAPAADSSCSSQTLLPGHQQSYSLVPGAGGRVEYACPPLGRSLAPQELCTHLLRHLIARAEAFLDCRQQQQQHGGAAASSAAAAAAPSSNCSGDAAAAAAGPHEAVVTVPADFGPAARAAVMEAARAAGLKRVTLLQEPIAAAMAYGFGAPTTPWDVLLVFDLGGGTLDVSVVESFEGIMEVLATDGDERLGGDDFTAALVGWAAQVQQQHPSGAGHSPSGLDLWRAAEAAKVALSQHMELQGQQQQHPLGTGGTGGPCAAPLDAAERGLSLASAGSASWHLSADEFDDISRPLLQRLWPPLERVAVATRTQFTGRLPDYCQPLQSARGPALLASGSGPGRRDGAPVEEFQVFPMPPSASASGPAARKYSAPPRRLTGVVLVGAATRMPAVRAFVQEVTGLPLKPGVDPETAVALGAALHAGLMVGSVGGGVELNDGGYVAGQHGRSSGFQEAAAAAKDGTPAHMRWQAGVEDVSAAPVWEP